MGWNALGRPDGEGAEVHTGADEVLCGVAIEERRNGAEVALEHVAHLEDAGVAENGEERGEQGPAGEGDRVDDEGPNRAMGGARERRDLDEAGWGRAAAGRAGAGRSRSPFAVQGQEPRPAQGCTVQYAGGGVRAGGGGGGGCGAGGLDDFDKDDEAKEIGWGTHWLLCGLGMSCRRRAQCATNAEGPNIEVRHRPLESIGTE